MNKVFKSDISVSAPKIFFLWRELAAYFLGHPNG